MRLGPKEGLKTYWIELGTATSGQDSSHIVLFLGILPVLKLPSCFIHCFVGVTEDQTISLTVRVIFSWKEWIVPVSVILLEVSIREGNKGLGYGS